MDRIRTGFFVPKTGSVPVSGPVVDQLAQVSVKQHYNAARNPYAQYQKEVTLEEVLDSRMIASPLNLLMNCANADGGAAVMVSVTEHWENGGCTATPSESPLRKECVAALRGSLHTTVDPQLGRTTLVRLPVDAP